MPDALLGKQLYLDVGNIQRAVLILQQIAGGGTRDRAFATLYRDLNPSADTSVASVAGVDVESSARLREMDMCVMTEDVVKHITQRVVALACTKFTTLLMKGEMDFLVKYGRSWTDDMYQEVRTDKTLLACTASSAKNYEHHYVEKLCKDTVRHTLAQSAQFDNDMQDPSHLTQMFTSFVRAMPAMNMNTFALVCSEWMTARCTPETQTYIEYALLRHVIIETDALDKMDNVDIEDVIVRLMRCMKSHKDERLRLVVPIGHCASYWSTFTTLVRADLAVNKLSYENLHAVVCSLLLTVQVPSHQDQHKFRTALRDCDTSLELDDREKKLLRIARSWLYRANLGDYSLNGDFCIERLLFKLSETMSLESGWPIDIH